MPKAPTPEGKAGSVKKSATMVKQAPGKEQPKGKKATPVVKTAPKEEAKKPAAAKAKDDLDDIFAAKGKKSAPKPVFVQKGPTQEEIKAEEAKYKGESGKGARSHTEDGLPIYTEEEMEEEMGETAWKNFMDAAEPPGSVSSYT